MKIVIVHTVKPLAKKVQYKEKRARNFGCCDRIR